MAPMLRPNDRPFTPGAMAPPPGPEGPEGPMGPGGPPPVDPAEMERQAMLALLEQAEPVPASVRHYPDGVDTMPRPDFPADGTRHGRRPY